MYYNKITKFDTANGPGVRTTLWVSGCDHHCKSCHNPETWNPKSGYEFDLTTLSEILESLSPDYISGITFSGGDPLYVDNRYTISIIISAIREKYPHKSIWLYTGYTWEELLTLEDDTTQSLLYILSNIDVLVDGKFEISKKDISLPYCGSTNQRVINVKESLYSKSIILYKGDI